MKIIVVEGPTHRHQTSALDECGHSVISSFSSLSVLKHVYAMSIESQRLFLL